MQAVKAIAAFGLSTALAGCAGSAREQRGDPGRGVARTSAALSVAEADGPGGAQTSAVESDAERILRTWPEASRAAARAVIEKHGLPQEATPSRLIWHNTPPFVRTIVHGEEVRHNFPAPHADVVEQTVLYRVPPEKAAELLAYDGSLRVDRTRGELGAHCEGEAMNLLALNVAHDIANGRRSVDEARQFSAETAAAFAEGRVSPYTQQLLFTPLSRDAAADADAALPVDVASILQPRRDDAPQP